MDITDRLFMAAAIVLSLVAAFSLLT